jgi:hypothetical protein
MRSFSQNGRQRASNEVLISQTVLEKLDLHVDAAGQRLIPDPAHPDQTVTKVK